MVLPSAPIVRDEDVGGKHQEPGHNIALSGDPFPSRRLRKAMRRPSLIGIGFHIVIDVLSTIAKIGAVHGIRPIWNDIFVRV